MGRGPSLRPIVSSSAARARASPSPPALLAPSDFAAYHVTRMDEALLIVLGSFGGFAVLVWALLHQQRKVDELRRIWAVAAKRLGGRFEETVPLVGARIMRIRAMVQDVRIIIEDSTGYRATETGGSTRARAPAPGSGALKLRVQKERLLTEVGRTLGFEDLQVGDRAFDAAFEVRANDADLARAWLDETSRQAISGLDAYAFVVEAGEIRAERTTVEGSTKGLESLAHALVAVATAGTRLLDRWKDLAAELGGEVWTRLEFFEPSSEVVMALERGRAQVRVDVLQTEASGTDLAGLGLVTRLRARAEAGSPGSLAVVSPTWRPRLEASPSLAAFASPFGPAPGLELLATDEALVKAALDEVRWRRAVALDPLAVVVDEREVTVVLPGLVFDARRLAAAADLAADLAAAPATGPYR